ncbi:MAG: N-6 DNA methylase [Bacteroidales bacterium]|nr:N-6 DNA methylase [Bacteroidales bacterium]
MPGNLFYGTTIPGAIIFFDKDKPADRKNKVLMVYAAKKGWYREEANMSVLEPQDVLRISTMLESWGDIEIAKDWIKQQKNRLHNQIEDEVDFRFSEIENDLAEEIARLQSRLDKAETAVKEKETAGKKPTAGERKAWETALKALDKVLAEKTSRENAAYEKAEKQRQAIADVETELLEMFADPERRKRYFSIVDMDEIEENEFNLNIPRYVDTFEPEEQIDMKEAIVDFQKAVQSEAALEKELNELLKNLQ